MSGIYIIQESAFVPSAKNDFQILEESVGFGNQSYRLKFKARLQTANVVNNNKRIYPTETLRKIANQLQPKAQKKELFGEMDHPICANPDKGMQMKRSSTISMQNVCVLYHDITFDGESIYGVCETLTNSKGLDLYSIIKDGGRPGFSLRAFGSVKRKPNGIVEVDAATVKALTFDCVLNQSHSDATIIEFINESTNPMELAKDLKAYVSTIEEQAQILTESGEFVSDENRDSQVCIGGICMRAPLEEAIDYIIEQGLKQKPRRISIKL